MVTAAYLIICYRLGAWKKWKEFYPTYLYVIVGDLAYNFIFYEKPLWEYGNFVSHTFSDFWMAMIVFPCAVTLFLTHYPKRFWKQALYILLWTVVNTAVEYVSYRSGGMLYYNNWSIAWSAALYLVAFILIRIHYVRPLWVWPISFACAFATMYLFGIPLVGLK